MAENLRSRHAFGSSENVSNAISQGLIDHYDILFLDSDTDPKIGWIDKNGEVKIVENDVDLSGIEAELAEKANSKDVVALETQISTKANASEVEVLQTEIANKVDATTVEAMIKEYSKPEIEVIEF